MNEALFDRLVGDLTPVRPRTAGRDFALVAGLALAQIAAVFAAGYVRADLDLAMVYPSFWWKAAAFALIGISAAGVAVRAMGPADRPRFTAPAIAAALGIGAGIVLLMREAAPTMAGAMHMMSGMSCVLTVFLLSLPMSALFGALLHRGAPARPARAALAAALASAGWGAFLFTFRCPHDDMGYNLVWFPVALAVSTLLLAAVLRRSARW